MAKDMAGPPFKEVLSRVVQDTGKNLSEHNPTSSGGPTVRRHAESAAGGGRRGASPLWRSRASASSLGR